MVFQASDAAILSSNSGTQISSQDVQVEISLAENKILVAAGTGLTQTDYNARIIGNPIGNPNVPTNLNPNQASFYDFLIEAGYLISLEPSTGFWLINWSPTGPEALVNIYSIRTVINPSSFITATTNAIQAFFLAQIPVMHTVVVYDNSINPIVFGGTSSVFYEFTVVINQGGVSTDFSSHLLSNICAQGLGYTISNTGVFKLV